MEALPRISFSQHPQHFVLQFSETKSHQTTKSKNKFFKHFISLFPKTHPLTEVTILYRRSATRMQVDSEGYELKQMRDVAAAKKRWEALFVAKVSEKFPYTDLIIACQKGLSWTDQQRAAAAKENCSYRLVFSARLAQVGVILLADALFLGAQHLGHYLQDIRSL